MSLRFTTPVISRLGNDISGGRQIIGALALMIAAMLFRPVAIAGVIAPTDLPAGSQYQLAFVTSLTTSATSKDTAFYNAFVTDRATASATLPSGVSWTAMAGTPSFSYIIETGSGSQFIVVPAVTPQQNAPTSSIPIYNTRGQRVVASGSAIWNQRIVQNGEVINPWDNPIQGDEFGVLRPTLNPNTQLGDVMYGSLGTWVQSGANYVSNGALMTYSSLPYWMPDEFPSVSSPSTVQMRLFALSSPITAVPEPSTYAMALAGIACGGYSTWRRKKRALHAAAAAAPSDGQARIVPVDCHRVATK